MLQLQQLAALLGLRGVGYGSEQALEAMLMWQSLDILEHHPPIGFALLARTSASLHP